MSEEILYKAKNSAGGLAAVLVGSLYMIGGAIIIFFVAPKYFTDLPSSFNNKLIWGFCFYCLLYAFGLFKTINNYRSNFICLTKESVVIKLGQNYNVVLYENIRLIKKCVADKRTYTLIKKKNGEEILGPSIKNINELSRQIRAYYPDFTNREGIVQDYDSNVRSSFVMCLIYYGIATYWAHKVIKFGFDSLAEQLFWCGIMFVYILGIIELIKLIINIKTRYFSMETRMMVDAIKTSEQEPKTVNPETTPAQEDENIITHYCPICGSKLIDFKCPCCEVTLDNIYEVAKNYCVNCGTQRANSEPDCLNCGLSFCI